MILFDNMYYLLYGYFHRTNSGKWGYKATSIILVSAYLFFSCLILLWLIKIAYYFIVISNSIPSDIYPNKYFWWDNKIIIYGLGVVINIFIDLRYYYFKNYNEIQEIKNEMNLQKREILDILTIAYLVTAPLLMAFVGNFVNNLYM